MLNEKPALTSSEPLLSGNTAISSDPYGLDFDGNSQSDIVWRHQATGQNVVWLMEGELGHQYRDYTALTNVGAGWDIKGVADFNQDGDPDILWRHQATGQNVVWHMGGNNNTTIESWDSLTNVGAGWDIRGINDFNQDGNPDLLWRHQATGQNVVWHMGGNNNTTIESWDRLTNVGAGWDIKGTADFNQDGDPDILWRHQATGQNVVWHMGGNNNTAIESWNRLTTVGGTWDIRGISDFNQDGRPGIFWRNNTTGENVIWHMQGANNTQIGSHNFVTTVGLGWEPILTGWSPSKLPEVAQTLTLSELSSSIQTGSTYDIRWADNLGGAVNIDLYKGSRFYRAIVQNTASDGSYRWTLPTNLAAGNDYQFRISSAVDSSVVDFSDRTFAITSPPAITVNTPSNTLVGGNTVSLTWADNISGNVKIELYKNNQKVQAIATSTASDGRYDWRIPDGLPIGSDYRLKITSTDNSVSDFSNSTFTIRPKPAITVNTPSNTLTGGSTVALTWSDTISGNVKIELYKGSQFARTITTATASDGRYDWQVPDGLQNASDYRLKITSTDGTVMDFSDNTFTIAPKSAITVTTPNGGNTLILGSTVALRWNDNISGNVKIELYNGSQKVQTIASSTPSDSLFNWKVPTNLARSDYYRLKITSLDGTVSDFSNANFTITPQPVITVGSPSGGNTLTAGNTVTLRWSDNINGDVNIELYKGNTRVQTIANVTPSDGAFNWRVPESLAAGTDYRLKIYASGNAAISDFSNSNITILPKPVITVGEINSNQSIEAGKVHSILWNDNFNGNVKIELYKGGKYQQTIVSSTLANGRYDWAIPSTFKSGDDYTFKVSSVNSGNNASDVSNKTFAIAPKKDGFNIEFDYRYAGSWFSSAKRTVLEKAAELWESIILDEFDNVAAGTRTTILNPSTGAQVSFNINKEVDDIIVFVGARNLPGTTLAQAGSTNYQDARHTGNDYEPWSGQLVFDTSPTWYLNSSTSPSVDVPSGQSDFLSVAVHELGHVLGISSGTPAFRNLTQNGKFIGAASKALNNGDGIPLHQNSDGTYSHIEEDFEIEGIGENSLDPSITRGTRKLLTLLDAALIDDIGYDVDYAPLKQVEVLPVNNGNSLRAGSSYTINWGDNFKENVKIELYKGGRYYRTIASSTVSDGAQNFTVSNSWAAGSDYTLKVSSVLDGRVFDVSDRTFSITPQSGITITSPNGGNSFTAGQNVSLTWNDTISGGVYIYLYKGGKYNRTIASNTASDGQHTWKIPDDVAGGDDYQVRIVNNGSTISDYSDRNFTINPKPAITITSPNGGNRLTAGQNVSLTWSDNIAGNVYIYLYKGGKYNRTIVNNTASDGQYTWKVPDDIASGSDYQLKIVNNGSTISDYSNSNFTISPKAAITISSPNGGGTITGGSTVPIFWNDTISENVNIYLYKGSSYQRTIASNTASDSRYDWKVPDNLASGSDYKIRIVSVNGTVDDYSDRTFSIAAQPNITVTSPNGNNTLTADKPVTLTWNDNISSNVKIELYRGSQYNRTISTSTASDGSFNWIVPEAIAAGNNYRLKITALDNSYSDYSNGYFTINAKSVASPPTSNGAIARHGLTSSQYQAAFDTYVAQGYRLVDVSGSSVGTQDRYAAIWTKASGPNWVARHGLTSTQYQAVFDDYTAQGYRPTHVSGYSVNGQDRYAAIWTKESGPAWIARHGLTSAQYQSAFDSYTAQGYRPIDVSGYSVNGQDRYAAIWTKESGPAWIARHGLTSTQYQSAFDSYTAQGYRPIDVSGYSVNGQDRYAAIWTKESGPAWIARHGLTSTQYQTAFDDFGAQGYQLETVSNYDIAGQTYYAAIWTQ